MAFDVNKITATQAFVISDVYKAMGTTAAVRVMREIFRDPEGSTLSLAECIILVKLLQEKVKENA